MSMLPQTTIPTQDLTYPPVVLDGKYGQQVQIPLLRTMLVENYYFVITLGTLQGGTNPAWTVSGSNPLITHVNITADNEVLVDADTQMLQFKEAWSINDVADGLHLRIRVADIDLRTGDVIQVTGLPSYAFSQILLTLTVAPLSQVTSGGPTGSTGTTLYLTETSCRREFVNFRPYKVKHLQISTTLPINGVNDLTAFLSQDGAYSLLLFYVDTGASGYSAPSDTAVQKYSLIINSTNKIRDNFTTALKALAQQTTAFAVPTGVAPMIFKPSREVNKLLHLADTRRVTNVDLQVTTTVANARLVALKVEYF